MSRRILLAGSEKWSSFPLVHENLMDAWKRLGSILEDITLVMGGAPAGAEQMAANIWSIAGQPVELYETEWYYGRRIGPDRSAEMVASGANLCVAFIQKHDPYPTAVARLAQEQGIPTRIFRE